MPRATYTYAVLEISQSAYDEIRQKLVAAGYQHALHDSDSEYAEVIDMHGIAVASEGPNETRNHAKTIGTS